MSEWDRTLSLVVTIVAILLVLVLAAGLSSSGKAPNLVDGSDATGTGMTR